MFKQAVSTPLNSTASNTYYANILGSGGMFDGSMVSTVRALVSPRIGSDSITVYWDNYHFSQERIGRYGELFPNELFPGDGDITNALNIVNFNSIVPADNAAAMSAIENYFGNIHPDYPRVEKVTVYYKKQLNVLCYVCPERKTAVVFTDNINIRQYHYLQCAIPAFLPWYFTKEQGISDAELELINSLRENKADHYLACIQRFVDNTNIYENYVRRSLESFETVFEQSEKQRVENDITALRRDIESYNQRIAEKNVQIRRQQLYLFGLENALKEDSSSELADYLLANKKVEFIGTYGTSLRVYIEDRLVNFDEEQARTLVDNPRSFVYFPRNQDVSHIIPPEDMKRLFTAVFIDRSLYIRCGAAIQINLNEVPSAVGNYAHPYSFDYSSKTTATPNPHLWWHNCFGGYQNPIMELANKRDYLGAVEQAIASVKSLHLMEGATVAPFMNTLYIGDRPNRCIELPDGSVVTPKEAIAFLKKEEQENGETDQTDAE